MPGKVLAGTVHNGMLIKQNKSTGNFSEYMKSERKREDLSVQFPRD
jgi:hypothetical protein